MKAWIVQGYNIAKDIERNCYRCIIKKKQLINQKMGDLPVERAGVTCPPPSPTYAWTSWVL